MRIVLGTLYGLLALAGAAATAGGAAGGRLLRGRRLLAEVGAAQGSHEPGFTPPSCAECLDFAQLLLDDLRAAYPHKAKDPEDEDEELVGSAGQRRRMIHAWSELEIYSVLDNMCQKNAAAVSDAAQCVEMTNQTRDEVENYVFRNGPEGVRELVCAHLLGSCHLHEVEGDGELR